MSEVEISTATPLLAPAAGTPDVIDSEATFKSALSDLAKGTGPFAVDAERASGYKYSSRAYLIQIKRNGGGLHLIDPIPFGPGHQLFIELNELLNTDEVILHASTQDLPCLRELGINPKLLFDTELGGRIAGLPRVGLGPLLEAHLGVLLAKEHSAVDWSVRPLPQDWLNYAALDVELLVELRNIIAQLLLDAKKLSWAEAEFAAILAAPPSPPRVDPWRRTSGMHKIRKRNQLAIIRALWNVRNEIAAGQDVSPGKLLNDSAIVELAMNPPTNKREFDKVLRPIGLRARWKDNLDTWLATISTAVALPENEHPEMRAAGDSMPPTKIWKERFPEKYAPFTHARAAVEARAAELNIPVENLIAPDVIRKLVWKLSTDVEKDALDLGARPWQVAEIADLVTAALLEREPLAVSEPAEPSTEPE
ncbi:Rnd Ribonuclease D [Candidatus Nanopelagicaceae bacterium]|jgi:ribonuclease D